MKRTLAFTLLEMLLVLTIASAILIMATRYFTISMRNMRVTQAISDIKSITKASYEWLQTQKQENFSSNPNGTDITMEQLIEYKLIQPNNKNQPQSYYDPWGGEIEIGPGSDPSHVYILMKNIPKMACLNLVRKTRSLMENNSILPACDKDKNNNYYGVF